MPALDRANRVRRRRVLGFLSAATVGALAGCVGDDDSAADDTEPEDEDESGGDDSQDQQEREDDEESDSRSLSELEADAEAFVELLVEDAFDSAYEQVTERFEGAVPQAELEAIWEREVDPLGEFQGFESVEYRGEEDGSPVVVVVGQFDDAPVQYTVIFEGDLVTGFFLEPQQWEPPEYVDEGAFEEEQLTLDAPGDCGLGATLTMPTGDDSVAGVVFVHGSGDQERDQTAGPNKTFKELAWGLATEGVATLRYDQRPFACDVDRTEATIDDLIVDDALTAVDRLRAKDRIDSVIVAGHSLGGRLAPRIAVQDSNLDGLVMLAPLAESVPDAIVRQSRHQFEVEADLPSDEVEEAMETVEALSEQLRTLDIDDDELINLGGGERGRPFFESLAEFEHVETAAELSIPRLLVQGERDSFVTVDDDLPIWQEAFGDDPAVDIQQYEDLNHRFQPVGRATPRAVWFEQQPVAEQVVVDVAAFVDSVVDQ